MRNWRKTHPLNEEQKIKDNARSYLGVYVRRGKIEKLPCKICNEPKSEGHHPDYKYPLFVIWLCRPHHMEEHQKPVPSW